MKYIKPLVLVLTVLAFIVILLQCSEGSENRHNKSSKPVELHNPVDMSQDRSVVEPVIESIDTVNFYFENSASMNGYLRGDNFLEVMHRIIGNVDNNQLNSYFVNTDQHKVDNLLHRIDKGQIRVGNTSSSDHQFIFKNAIDNARNNNLSIVVTDGIYSVDGRRPNIVAIDIEQAFKDALRDNEIETVILKLSSKFNGTYYSESCKPGHKAININQNRPYYVLLFGRKGVMDKALNEVVETKDLPGFEEKARFFITKDKDVSYTVLTRGDDLHGKVEPQDRRKREKLHKVLVEKYTRSGCSRTPNDENYLSFEIPVDFSGLSIPNSYLTDINNYEVEDDLGYEITKIKKVSELGKSSKTFKALDRLKHKYTHVIVVKASKNLFGELEIELENNLPAWIKETGVDSDCNIIGDENHTFAFDQLMKGISKAYQKINDDDDYAELEIKIKPL